MIPRKLPFGVRIINRAIRFSDFELGHSQFLNNRIKSGEFNWLRQRNIKTVLDIGANTGQFATMIHAILPETTIYSFEPLDQCFEVLKLKTERIPMIQCFHCALGGENTEAVIHANEFTPSSSLLQMTGLHKKSFPYTINAIDEKVQVRTLDSVSPELDLCRTVLAKIDVQGFELNVLQGGEKTLSDIDIIIVETSFERLYENQPLFDDLYQYLQNRGFRYRGNFDQVVSVTNGEPLQADAIFSRVRDDAR